MQNILMEKLFYRDTTELNKAMWWSCVEIDKKVSPTFSKAQEDVVRKCLPASFVQGPVDSPPLAYPS